MKQCCGVVQQTLALNSTVLLMKVWNRLRKNFNTEGVCIVINKRGYVYIYCILGNFVFLAPKILGFKTKFLLVDGIPATITKYIIMSVVDLAEAGGEKDGVPERTHHTRLLLPQTGQDQGAELTAMRWHKVSTVLAQRHHQLVDRGANLNRITVIFTVHVCRQLCRLMVKSIHVHNLDDFQVLVDGIIIIYASQNSINNNLEVIKVMYIHECFSPSTSIIDSPLIIYTCQQHQRQSKQINYIHPGQLLFTRKKEDLPTHNTASTLLQYNITISHR